MDSSYTNSTAIFVGPFMPCKRESAAFAFLAMVELFTVIVGFPANVTVLWVLLRRKTAVSSTEIFILNLTVMDALLCLSAPLGILYSFLKNYLIGCATYFLYSFNLIGTPLFLCCICLERYTAVVHPIRFLHLKSRTFRVAFCAMSWVYIVAMSLYQVEHMIVSWSYLMALNNVTLLVVMVFCNVSILWSLIQSSPGRDELHPVKKKAFQTVFTNFIILLLFYFLPAVYLLLSYINVATLQCYVMPVWSFFAIPLPLFYLYNMGKVPCAQFPCCAVQRPSP
ncbi:UNVERIFIED_CONTAM: hypothetical protein FKN15_054972 [Acipenser sinensis]